MHVLKQLLGSLLNGATFWVTSTMAVHLFGYFFQYDESMADLINFTICAYYILFIIG